MSPIKLTLSRLANMYFVGSLATILLAANGALAVGSPFGWATGTTGGASAAQAIPTSAAQLKSWLEDSVTRNILLDRTYDFTDTEGSITGAGCKPWSCSPTPQLAINALDWCNSHPVKETVTYKKAATTPIQVRSNKTILGKGTSGWIKGKGLRIVGASNIIVQNIRISDLNAQFVWGGDAITIHNSNKIWVDHNYIKDVGRAFIVTGFEASTQVTISNNYFNGQSTYSVACDKHHYWPFIISGNGDQITFARNYVYSMAGRAPKISGSGIQTVHVYNNYFHDINGHALDAGSGARVLFEGNYMNSVKQPSTGDANGVVFAPTSSSMSAQCNSSLSRQCKANVLAGSGTLTNTANVGALSSFTASFIKAASLWDASQVSAQVLANAGTGKVN